MFFTWVLVCIMGRAFKTLMAGKIVLYIGPELALAFMDIFVADNTFAR